MFIAPPLGASFAVHVYRSRPTHLTADAACLLHRTEGASPLETREEYYQHPIHAYTCQKRTASFSVDVYLSQPSPDTVSAADS